MSHSDALLVWAIPKRKGRIGGQRKMRISFQRGWWCRQEGEVCLASQIWRVIIVCNFQGTIKKHNQSCISILIHYTIHTYFMQNESSNLSRKYNRKQSKATHKCYSLIPYLWSLCIEMVHCLSASITVYGTIQPLQNSWKNVKTLLVERP